MITTVKRLLAIILVLAMALSTGFVKTNKVINADEKGQIMVSSSYEDRRGKTVNLSVLLTNVEQMAAGSFELHYNPNVGYVTSTEQGNLLENVMYVENTEEARNGVIKVAWAGTDKLQGEGTLLNFEFRVMHSSQEYDTSLDLHNVQLFDQMGKEIDIAVVDGFVKPFAGKKETERKNIASNKGFTVTFNTPMSRSTLNPHTIFVTDENDKRVPIKVTMSKDKQSVTVSPQGRYIKGSYILTISDQIKSKHGDQLKEAVRLPFTVN